MDDNEILSNTNAQKKSWKCSNTARGRTVVWFRVCVCVCAVYSFSFWKSLITTENGGKSLSRWRRFRRNNFLVCLIKKWKKWKKERKKEKKNNYLVPTYIYVCVYYIIWIIIGVLRGENYLSGGSKKNRPPDKREFWRRRKLLLIS